MTRRAAVVKVQIARRDLGLDEDTYRAMLTRITGENSASHCTDVQLGRVLDEFKAKGWTPKVAAGGLASRRRGNSVAGQPMARKARALWISLHQLGVVRDPSEAALERFAARQLGVERLVWASASHGYRLIEALKAMAQRAGWDQATTGLADPEAIERELKARLERLIALRNPAG